MDALEYAPSYRLLCPEERYNKDKDGKVTRINGQIHHIIETSYCISDVEDEKFDHHHHSLLCRNKNEGEEKGLFCFACDVKIIGKTYYRCSYCEANYHKECVESPSLFQSSDHPKHSLQLLWFPESFYEHERDRCSSCRKIYGRLFYYCSICDFMIHPFCAKNSTSLTIDNPKRHKHTLHYFPRKSTLVCDVCALDGDHDYLYVCLLCDFIVHKRCVYLPFVIKVSRHIHRLAFTWNLHNKEWSNCGVCQTKIKENYGQYSCMKGCVYAVHPRCTMRRDVCDGKELEGEPEEAYGNIKMFEEKGDGIIQHLSHPGHLMRLDKKIQRVYDENKLCQACILPLYDDGNVYRCMRCDFILHESCAYLPGVKQFVLHVHPLILEFGYTTSWVQCKRCFRYLCDFTYACRLQKCDVKLDIHCASICEPFDYHAHRHPLFITFDERAFKSCSVCKLPSRQPLNCVKCDFVSCFHCATLPQKARYENDDHLLTFSYEKEDANEEFYWCEVCEKDINPKNGLYACNQCGVTLHIECLLGKDPYMKPGQSRTLPKETVRVLANTCSTRPICRKCKRRCPCQIKIESSYGYMFCSVLCYRFFLPKLREDM